jgi:hypothetical protein
VAIVLQRAVDGPGRLQLTAAQALDPVSTGDSGIDRGSS